jgi:hypothetical protein
MQRDNRKALLYLNGKPVGFVQTEASADAWGWGHFTPAEEFSSFAPLFGVWALLLHEDDDSTRLSREAREELRHAETAIDRLTAELLWVDSNEFTPIRQLTIDGTLIEWNSETK